jgi:peptidyl-prolyl cis-trans isomerase D
VALFAFIIGDFLTKGSTFFNSSRENVGEVNGQVIKIYDYQEKIEQITEIISMQSGQTRNFSELEMGQLREQIWNDMVSEIILNEEAKKLDLVVTEDELSDRLIGNNIHPMISNNSMFFDENGIFSRAAVINFLDYINMDPGNNSQMATDLARMKNYWLFIENEVRKSVLSEKYNTLIAKSFATNSLEAKMNFDASKTSVDLKYVVKPYYTIPDSLVAAPTSAEIKERYAKNKEQYKQEASRSASYISFDVKPSPEDYEATENIVASLKERFSTAEDVTNIVNSNSDVKYTGRNYGENAVPVYLKEFAFSGKKDDIFGPAFEDESYVMARIMETGISAPDSIRLSYFYLTADKAEKKDSLIRAIRSGGDFAQIYSEFSADQNYAATGGDIGWITENMQGLNNDILSAFEKPVNEIFTVNDMQGGAQIFKITEKTKAKAKVKLAILQRHVSASSNTKSRLFNEATNFLASVKTPQEFTSEAEKRGYFLRPATNIRENDFQFINHANSRQVVKWIYESKVNDISPRVFECDESFIVAMTTEINKKGYMPVDQVTPQLTAEILRDKKADYITNQINSVSPANLETIAATLGVDVLDVENLNFNSYQFGSSGFEPAVIGAASRTGLNQLSSPVKGQGGIFVVEVVNVNESSDMAFDANMQMRMMTSQITANLFYTLPAQLLEKATIVDNRSAFY